MLRKQILWIFQIKYKLKCLKLQPLIWTKKNLGALWAQLYIFDCYLTTNKIAQETKSVVKAFHFLVIVTIFITFYEVTRPKFGQIYNIPKLSFDTQFAYIYENWHNISRWNVEGKKTCKCAPSAPKSAYLIHEWSLSSR